jgi:rhodanese-related sulfurtransferase
MASRPSVVIIGGGIGGLFAANALIAQRLRVSVYEQASELGEVGAGVFVTPNAVRHLQRAGLGAAVEKWGARVGPDSHYFRHDGTPIAPVQVSDASVLGSYFSQRDHMEPVSRRELTRRLKQGLVTVLDVRPPDEFSAGHLPRAINIPLRELTKRLREVPKGQEIVAYCRGPYCVLAFEAVALLRKRGFNVRRLEDGFPEWPAAGLPVETDRPQP